MGCYLEDDRARVGTWAARTVWRAQGSNINGQVRTYLENSCLCALVLAILLVIGGVEQNPGPGVEVELYASYVRENSSIGNTVRHVWTLVS